MDKEAKRSKLSEQELETLSFWKENDIFGKSLAKNKDSKKEFVFYEGPPTANGHPGIHHLEARAFKDVIPRYKTMCGYNVRRKGGWDTHGLPVELQVEKELGLKSKKEIDSYGVAEFNKKCKESVWKYVHEWEDFTNRMGYWVDLNDPYITYRAKYIESLWNIVKTADDKKLLYKDYKVVPWCPRCGTGLSSHELAQGYQDVKDLAVTVKFRVKSYELRDKNEKMGTDIPTYLLAWTTTPWTLPGNVGLAVNEKIDYVKIRYEPLGNVQIHISSNEKGNETKKSLIEKGEYIVAKDIFWKNINSNSGFSEMRYLLDFDKRDLVDFANNEDGFFEKYGVKIIKGKDLIGLEYEPLYPFLKDNISGEEKEKLQNAYKVYPADFVTTEDGTGIVHTAVMYGQDDFELGTKVGLPKFHLVNDDGTFKDMTGFLAGKFVKDQETDIAIIKDLAGRGLLLAKEKYQHSYPHCWRCKTPLIYFARDSWYIRMTDLRDKMVKENEGINWEPAYIKEGRFGEWLREIKDWAISRERYWGTPLPIWTCDKCEEKKVIGSFRELAHKAKNSYYVIRHGESENNVLGILNGKETDKYNLTEKGKEQVKKTVKELKNAKIDMIVTSPFARAKQTGDILKNELGISDITVEEDLRELGFGVYDGKKGEDFARDFPWQKRFETMPEGGETYDVLKKRVGGLLSGLEQKYEGKNILIVTHATPAMMLLAIAEGLDRKDSIQLEVDHYIQNAEVRKINLSITPRNEEYEVDPHKPFIDEWTLPCSCGGEMKRVKEVMDVWFDSGAMPFAQDHYPFENKDLKYPADFISEAIDQTRGWFYTLHAVGAILGKGKAYKNVICLGHILDEHGKKMSKSVGNVVDPFQMMDKYGADPLRFWMYSVNQPGESKNFEEKTVDEAVKKVFNLAGNVLSFYDLYKSADHADVDPKKSEHILDRWILSRLWQLNDVVTNGLENYQLLEPTRAIREFVADLSQWYLRRSRDRIKAITNYELVRQLADMDDAKMALATTHFVLVELSKMMAPFTPFFAEYLYKGVGGDKESVHLEDWPEAGKVDDKLLKSMENVRRFASAGLEARMTNKINVRQPLSSFTIITNELVKDKSLVNVLKDEINVEEVIFKKSTDDKAESYELNTEITPALKEKGDLRELLRKIQDMRKEKGLSVGDIAGLEVTEGVKDLVAKYGDDIKKATNISNISVGKVFELKL